MVSCNQARASGEAGVISMWSNFLEIISSNKGSRRGKSETANW